MPFIGQDWRSPGDAWVKTVDGCWESARLLQPQRTNSDCSLDGFFLHRSERIRTDSDSSNDGMIFAFDGALPVKIEEIEDELEADKWQPLCFVKHGKSKEFVGCTSMNEAFCKLELNRAVEDVRKFNYVCKVVDIFVKHKLTTISGTARKSLLSLLEAIVMHSLTSDSHLNTVRGIVSDFLSSLTSGGSTHHCGSPKMISAHQDHAASLYQLLNEGHIRAPADCDGEAVTFLDLPMEVLRAVLSKLPDHLALLTAAQAHDQLAQLCFGEQSQWQQLCKFHFLPQQIEDIWEKLRKKAQLAKSEDARSELLTWRTVYFELKKYHGLREIYADMIHICCHCKALFWKGQGHPCISGDTAPSVRVIPQQFVDMLFMY